MTETSALRIRKISKSRHERNLVSGENNVTEEWASLVLINLSLSFPGVRRDGEKKKGKKYIIHFPIFSLEAEAATEEGREVVWREEITLLFPFIRNSIV